MNETILIFDFDGTIADTHHYIVKISNRLAHEFSYNIIDREEVEALRDKTAKEIIRYLKVPVLKIPAILARAKKELRKEISEVQPITGLRDVLHQLRSFGMLMGILSSNAAENIAKFLENHGLKIFDFIHCTTRVWSKNTTLERLIVEKNFLRDKVLYIGDEVRDITAAQKSGVRSVAVTWGYNSAKALKSHQPDFLVSEPADLLQLCLSGLSKNRVFSG